MLLEQCSGKSVNQQSSALLIYKKNFFCQVFFLRGANLIHEWVTGIRGVTPDVLWQSKIAAISVAAQSLAFYPFFWVRNVSYPGDSAVPSPSFAGAVCIVAYLKSLIDIASKTLLWNWQTLTSNFGTIFRKGYFASPTKIDKLSQNDVNHDLHEPTTQTTLAICWRHTRGNSIPVHYLAAILYFPSHYHALLCQMPDLLMARPVEWTIWYRENHRFLFAGPKIGIHLHDVLGRRTIAASGPTRDPETLPSHWSSDRADYQWPFSTSTGRRVVPISRFFNRLHRFAQPTARCTPRCSWNIWECPAGNGSNTPGQSTIENLY